MKEYLYGQKGIFQCEISDLIGRTMMAIEVSAERDEIKMTCADGVFCFFHEQNCCENVLIEDITGDIQDLIGYPILMAEESTSELTPEGYQHRYCEPESQTWTFYKLATIKGYVDIRWFGKSNGYYSEKVSLEFTPSQPKEKNT